MSKPPTVGSGPALNLSAGGVGPPEKRPLSTQAQVVTTKVLIATPGNPGDVAKPGNSGATLAQAGMIPKLLDKKKIQETPKSISTIPIIKHTSMPMTVSPATSTITVPHHLGQGGILQPQLKVIPGGSKITSIPAAQVSRGSHITTVRPGLPTATIMRSNLPGHPGGEAVLSQVYMYPPQGGQTPIQARLLAPSSVMANSLRLQAPTSQMSSVADHNRNLSQVIANTARGPYQAMSLGQTVISTDSKLAPRHPITLQVKADGSHPFTSIGGLKPAEGLVQQGTVANQQQPGQKGLKPPEVPPVQVEVHMVICSDNLADKSGKGEPLHVVGRADGRIKSRLEGGNTPVLQAAGMGKVLESKKTIKDICESKERLTAVSRELKKGADSMVEREYHARVYRPEMKLSLKTEPRHDPPARPGDPPTWQGGGGIMGTVARHPATVAVGQLQGPHKQTARMTISPGSLLGSRKTLVQTHTISSVAPSTGQATTTAATAILVSANTATGAVRQPGPNAIPVAKVYPRQQLGSIPGTTTRVISSIRLPTCSAPDTTSAPSSFQPTSVRGATAPLQTSGSHDVRRPQPSHTVISTQQPFHHPHNRYNFSSDLFGYNMIQPYQGQSYGTLTGAGLRATPDGHPRYPFVTTSSSASLSAAGGHTPQGTSMRYPVAMMIDPSSMGLTTGLQSSLDGHTGDVSHVTNQNNASSDSPTSVPNSGASPRPSILRKRVSEGSASRKHPISSLNSHLGRPDSPASKLDGERRPTPSPKLNFKRGLNFNKIESELLPNSQHSVESNASETSTDTAPSSVGSIKIKPDPDASLLNENSNDAHSVLSQIAEEGTPSPRKKQRKQVLKAATEHPDIVQDPSTDEEVETKPRISYKTHKKQRKANKAEHLRVVHYVKRTCPRLMDAYKSTCNWKPALNHFERYADVKSKEEKKTSIHEIANQRGIVKKTEGWKVKHISGQFEDLMSLEREIHDDIEDMKTGLGTLQTREQQDSECANVYELVQGSLQRSKYVIENLDEARSIVLKLLEHKPKVSTILKKHANKRQVKKKHTSP